MAKCRRDPLQIKANSIYFNWSQTIVRAIFEKAKDSPGKNLRLTPHSGPKWTFCGGKSTVRLVVVE